jgi:hypothetical protein
MDTSHLMPGKRALRVVDAALATWVAAWIALGVAIGVNVDELTALSHTVVAEGRAVETIGGSLRGLSSVPFVGGEASSAGSQVQHAGASAVASGTSSASSIHSLSVLLAIAVALLPSVPVFGFYLPLRVRRGREARALRVAVRTHGQDPAFQSFLARRAIASLGYEQLRRVSSTPWDDVHAGRCAQLAAAELRRLGIDPTPVLIGQGSG